MFRVACVFAYWFSDLSFLGILLRLLLYHISDMVGLCPGPSQGPCPEAVQGRVSPVNFLERFFIEYHIIESFE